MNNDAFQKSLDLGIAGENKVYEYLKVTNSLVMNTRLHKHDDNIGPRMHGLAGSIVLPDFIVYNKFSDKGNFAVDVKVKKSIYPVNSKMCFTVDNKFEDYLKVVQIMNLDYLALIFVFEDNLYFYKDSDLLGTTTYNNAWSKGTVYLFEFDKAKICG
jgi:hypothetical protein